MHPTQWIEQHPDGEIVVTEELADKMGIESSGIENAQVTTQVEDFVDGAHLVRTAQPHIACL